MQRMYDQKWQFLPYKVTFTELQAGADKKMCQRMKMIESGTKNAPLVVNKKE